MRKKKQYIGNPTEIIRFEKIPRVHHNIRRKKDERRRKRKIYGSDYGKS